MHFPQLMGNCNCKPVTEATFLGLQPISVWKLTGEKTPLFAFYPLRSKLTSDAEKESIMMFGRNLRQLLLMSPVRGRTMMGVDPGYKHGCKLAIISPTSKFKFQIFHQLLKHCLTFEIHWVIVKASCYTIYLWRVSNFCYDLVFHVCMLFTLQIPLVAWH